MLRCCREGKRGRGVLSLCHLQTVATIMFVLWKKLPCYTCLRYLDGIEWYIIILPIVQMSQLRLILISMHLVTASSHISGSSYLHDTAHACTMNSNTISSAHIHFNTATIAVRRSCLIGTVSSMW